MKEKIIALCNKLEELVEQCAYDEIITAAQVVLKEDPGHARALEYLACAYVEKWDKDRALSAAKNFALQYPKMFKAQFLVARAYHLREEYGQAMKILLRLEKRSVELASHEKGLLYNLLGNTCKVLGETKRSLVYFEKAILPELGLDFLAESYDSYLFNLHYSEGILPEVLYQAHIRYNAIFSQIKQYQHNSLNRKGRTDDKIRIGYISPDIRDHVVIFFSYKLFTAYDRKKFHVTCYMRGPEDAISREIQDRVDSWRNVSKISDEETACLIYEDCIDILVDLAGHTRRNALPVLAYKPAPVQICGIGYFDTTGLEAVDYFITDKYCDPQGQNDAQFVERLIRLPHSHFCYTAPDTAPPCGETPCLRNGFVTFGSFNNFSKTTDAMLRVWKRILQALPDARLILKNSIFNGAYGREYTKKRLEKLGFSMEQVEFRPETAVYLPEYREIDIALDTYPYPGGGTSCDALYMGVPVITLVGERHGSRFGYSLLKNLALEDCIAFSPEEYVKKALVLAGNMERLNDLHLHLRERMQRSPLMDGNLYMRELEAAYLGIWQDYLAERTGKVRRLDAEKTATACWAALRENDYAKVLHLAQDWLTGDAESGDAFYFLARVYFELGAPDDAASYAESALQKGSRYAAEAYQVLGKVCLKKWQYMRAADAFARGLEIAQKEANGPNGRVASLAENLGGLQMKLGEYKAGCDLYLLASQAGATLEARAESYSSYLLALHCDPEVSAQTLFTAHLHYAAFFAAVKPYRPRPRHTGKIRIAYLSPYFRQHGMLYFYYQLLACYDKTQFHVTCYALGSEDAFTSHLKGLVDDWRDLRGMSYEEAAAVIYEDEIDILYDLAGHSANSGLPILAYRPAPVQLSGLGYMSTTGLPAVDWFVGDVFTDPTPQDDGYFTERLLRLSQSHFCYTGRSDVGRSQGAPCEKNGYVTFCSFNQYAKLTDEMLLAWKEILSRTPRSRLVLKCQVFASEEVRELARQRLGGLGFALERVELRPATDTYMNEYLDMDIALDTYPYPGGGTTCDALYMGVPVVTLAGDRHSRRFGYSILKNVGLEELVAEELQAYVDKAVALASEGELLDILHKNLRDMLLKSPLMDEKAYVGEMETLYKYLAENAGKSF